MVTAPPAAPSAPSLPAFQNFCAFNALNLEAAWSAHPERSEALWRGLVDHGDRAWAQRFAPLIDRLMAPTLSRGLRF